ncbi:MAG TPA: HAD family hydrolase [Vicinamibacterales bacterium]|nr:HAD family hydrolase [Vicinamibacterales bacterium]
MRAVLFDVDFTLIYPGPTFQGQGYRAFCEQHGLIVDESRFELGIAAAAGILDGPGDPYDAEVFVAYTRRIIETMGGTGERVDACARQIYDEWAACHHFHLYDEVPDVLRALSQAGMRIGLVSNSHRCLASFQSHFELDGLIDAAISSPEHGFLKPNPSIFRAALELLSVNAREAVMVGDSVTQDVEGALAAGMRAVLLHRGAQPHRQQSALAAAGVPVINSLHEVPAVVRAFSQAASP